MKLDIVQDAYTHEVIVMHGGRGGIYCRTVTTRGLNLIAASIYDKLSRGPSIRPVCTRYCFTMTSMIQVCSNFHRARLPKMHTTGVLPALQGIIRVKGLSSGGCLCAISNPEALGRWRKVYIRLPGKGNSSFHGARPVHQNIGGSGPVGCQ